MPRNATAVPEAGGDLVVLGVFGRCVPVLTSVVATAPAVGLGAFRESANAVSPSKERAVASIESCLGPRMRSGCATVEWWRALSSGDLREGIMEFDEGLDRGDAHEVKKKASEAIITESARYTMGSRSR